LSAVLTAVGSQSGGGRCPLQRLGARLEERRASLALQEQLAVVASESLSGGEINGEINKYVTWAATAWSMGWRTG